MNPLAGYMITAGVTILVRLIGMKLSAVEVFGIFAHLGLGFFYYLDPKGTQESRSFQRQYVLYTLNFLFAVELCSRVFSEGLINLIFFPVAFWMLLSPVKAERLFVCAVSLSVLMVTNPAITVKERLLYACTFLAFWGVGLYRRIREKGHLDTLLSRLKKYESEDFSINKSSGEYSEKLSVESKNWKHQQAVLDDRDRLFKSLVDLIYHTYEPFTCCIYLYDDQNEQFNLKAVQQKTPVKLKSSSKESEGIFAAAFAQSNPTRLISSKEEGKGFSYYEEAVPTQILWMVPIFVNQKKKALLCLDFTHGDRHAEEMDAHILRLKEHAETLIAQLEASIAHFKVREEIALLYRATLKLKDVNQIQDIYKEVLASLHEMAPHAWALGLSYDKEAKKYRVLAEKAADKEKWSGKLIPALESKTILSWVLHHKKFLYFPTYSARSAKYPLIHPEWPTQQSFESLAVWPITVKDEIEGLFIFGFDQEDALPRNMQRLISVFFQQVSSAVVQRRMLFQLEQLATLDGLTGVFNHRALQDQLTNELERSKRQNASLSLIILDIDWFKKFNDEYGHRAGDFVLKKVAHTVTGLIRKIDIFARYGGEEFFLVLPNTSQDSAHLLAKRIVEEVAKKTFEFEGIKLKVTVSAGVATYPAHAIQKDLLIEYADRALYEAKRSGRNRSVMYGAKLRKVDLFSAERTLVDMSEEQLRRRVDQHSQTA